MPTAAKKTAPKKNAPSRKRKKKSTIPTYSIWIIICAILSIILCVFMYIDQNAFVNHAVKTFLFGLFGKTAYLIPPALAGLTIYLSKTRDMHKFELKAVLVLTALITTAALVGIFGQVIIPASLSYQYGVDGIGGGLLGGSLAFGLFSLCHRIVSVIILFALLILLVSLITKVSILTAVFTFFKGLFVHVGDELQEVKQIDNYEKGVQAKEKLVQYTAKKHSEVFDLPIEATEMKPEKTSSRKRKDQKHEKEETLDIPIMEPAVFPTADAHNPAQPAEAQSDIVDDAPVFIPLDDKTVSAQTEIEEPVQKAETITNSEKDAFADELDQAMTEEKTEYIFPSLELLNQPRNVNSDTRREMYETANRLIEILKNFNVEAKLLQVTQGPSVTRYEIQPNTGVKLSKIVGLADDIALNLAVSTVLVAPVPGKAAVGIEVPNQEVSAVSIREMLESEEFLKAKSKLSVALGRDIGGRVIVGDIAKMPHVLIAGQTGSGKSVCINTIITSILYKSTPDEVKLIMVDPKVVELGVYNGIPHLLIPVVTDPKRAAGALNWGVQEMMKRYDLFAQTSVRNLDGYNKLMEKSGGEKMPQIVIIIDELADLMMVAAKEVEDYVCRLAQLARAAGIHLIIATQRPSVDVITGLIKANVPSRIAFSVASQVDSRTILDKGGAEKLLGRGDMLYYPTGARAPMRVQGAFVSDDEIEHIVEFLKETSEENSYSEDLAEHIERCSIGENGITPDEKDDGDEYLPKAIELAAELGQISTAMIQRKLKVGYSRAGRIIDQMEDRGIISGANGSKPRQVYLDRLQWSQNHEDIERTSDE